MSQDSALVIVTSKQQFDELINGSVPVIVDFYADWCGPCKLIAPKFAKAAEEFKGKVIFAKVNVDDVGDVAQACSIRAMPTFIAYKNGAKAGEVVGANFVNVQKLFESLV
ncbi:unnamed protein product [Cunninghamella blakesleeana]